MSSGKFSPFYKTDFDHIKILNCCYVTHQMMFKTAFLREIKAYSDDRATWCHDWDSTLRSLQAGARIKHVPELLYAWRINPGSTASAETAEKPEALASQRFVLQRYLENRGLDEILYPEINWLGPNTGMWSICARSTVRNIAVLDAGAFWSLPAEKRIKRLRNACDAGDYTLLLLEGTDQRLAELELSVPMHLDCSIKLVGSTLLDAAGHVAWAGGVIENRQVKDPAFGLDPRKGGDHGQLYCQRLIDVAAAANVLIANELLAKALDAVDGPIEPDGLMIRLAQIARSNGWLSATTPRLEGVLPGRLRQIIPLDRQSLLSSDDAFSGRSQWMGAESI